MISIENHILIRRRKEARIMKKCYFPKVAVSNFNEMPVEKLQREIDRSLDSLIRITPRNHKEKLLLVGNYKRVAVLKVILQYKNQPELIDKIQEIAVLVD